MGQLKSKTRLEQGWKARQEHGVPREASPEKAAILRDAVPIAKVEKDEASGSLTTEGSKERLCKPNEEEENKML